MIRKNEHIKQLYTKYLAHRATPLEYDQLFDYLKNPENLEILKQEMNHEWRSGSNQEQISPLDWEDIEIEIRKRKANDLKVRIKRRNIFYKWVAAAAIMLLVIGFLVFISNNNTSEEFITYTTGFGEVEKITLDDGSRITLNANSTLKWRFDWKEENDRLAFLDGEAYFDVKTILNEAGQKMGFDVQTDDLTLKVVGTAFNVKSRTGKTDVFLNEGIVHLNLNEEKNLSKEHREKTSIVMKPGESVSYSAVTKKLDRAADDHYGNASWMAGTFIYTKEPLDEILKSLEDIYGVDFEVEDKRILGREFTAALPFSDWPIVESSLELLLKARLERIDNTIKITRTK